MKSLPNSTNGIIVLSDSFATSIFKQSFLRVFSKDDQDFLQMGFNATFDVQVYGSSFRLLCSLTSGTAIDYQGTQGFRPDRARYIRWQEVSLCGRDRDRYWSNFGMEIELRYPSNICCSVLRSRHARWSGSPARFTWSCPIRHSLSALVWSAAPAGDDHRAQLCRSRIAKHCRFV